MNYLKAMSTINNWDKENTTEVEKTAIELVKQISSQMYDLEYSPSMYRIWEAIQSLTNSLEIINPDYE